MELRHMLQINQKKFRDEEKKFWTGIDVLDKTITMKKEKWMLWI